MKKSKKISVLISLVLITLLALGAVSAAEDTAVTDDASVAAIDEVQTVDDATVTDEINYESNDIIVTDTGDSSDYEDAIDDVVSDSTGLQEISDNGDEAVVSDVASPKNALKAEPLRAEPDGNFSALYAKIDGATAGSTITLDRNYVYNSNTDSARIAGIAISKGIIIDGAGYTIDGKDTARIFSISTTSSVTLKNLNIINGRAQAANRNYYGGAIYAQNVAINLVIDNCNFTDNQADPTNTRSRGGILVAGNNANVTIKNSNFNDNAAYYGGILYLSSATVTIENSNFTDNSAKNQGGIFYTSDCNVNITNSSFKQNSAPTGGVYYSGNVGTLNIVGSNFTNNSATNGGVIYTPNSPNINESSFIGNKATASGGVIYLVAPTSWGSGTYNTVTFRSCVLINNSADTYGGVAYLANDYSQLDMNYNVIIDNTADRGHVATYTTPNAIQSIDYNWWGANVLTDRYNIQSESANTYMSPQNHYILKLRQLSATVIEVSLNSLDTGTLPDDARLPEREYFLSIIPEDATIRTPTGNFSGAAVSNFTVPGNGTITAKVDYETIVLDIYQNTRGTIDLNVTIANVVLPNKAVAYVEASFDDIYNVTVGDKVYAVTVTNGHGQVEIDELPAGTYLAMLSHVDNDEFHDAYNLTTFNVTKAQSAISLTANTTSPTFGQEVKVTPTVTSADGTATITTGTIVYTVDGKNYASLEANQDLILTGLSAGEHRVVAKFGGNDGYEPSTSLELLINVQKAQITLSIVGAEVVYPESGKLTLNSNVDGVYKIYIEGTGYEVRVSLGSGTVAIPTMAVGNYTATVNVAESENYTAASATGTYNVTKADVKFTIDGDDRITYGETNVIVPTLTEGATGTITYYVDGAETGTEVVYPNTFTTPVLNAGSHTIRAEYAGDDNYKGKNATFTFNIAQAEVDVTVTGATVVYPIHANVTVTASAAGTYTITVNGKEYDVEITEDGGSKLVTLDEIPVGVHYVAVNASATTNYKAVDIDKAATVVVNKPQLNLTVSSEEITYGDIANVKITLKDGETGLSMTGLIVSVGSTYYPVNIVDGQGTLPVSGLNVGTYNVIAVCSYSENYDVAIANGTITVTQATPAATVTVTVNPITYGEDAVINIGLDGVNDEKITGVVKVTVDSKEYDVVVTNGVGTLTVSGLATNAEGYTITATFAGNDNYGEATGTGSVVVNKADATVTVSADKTNIKYGETATLSSVVSPSDDDGAVTYYVDGTAITGTTVSGLSVGEHTVVAKVAATDNYNEATSEALTITVAKADATITVSADKDSIKYGESITLTSDVTPGDDGAVTYYVDGTAITGTTVSGLSVGTHTVVAKVAATDNYNAAESEALTITVAKADATIELTIDDNELTFGESTTVSSVVSPSDDDGAVTYYVDGTAITGTTVSGLSVGTHTVVAKVAATANYNAAESAAKTITVSKATPEITITSEPVTYPSDAIVNIVLTGANSAALPGATIRVTINGTTYAVTTDNDGKASLTVKGLNVGEYAIAAVSVADNSYNSATYDGSAKVVVNKADATITVSADKTSIKYGESTTLSSVVTPSDDDGAVTYYVDGTAITGTTVSGLSVGTHSVVAKVAETDNYNAAESEALTITVAKADATVTVSADKETIKFGETATLSSVVSPSDDDGAVTYYVDGTAITGTTVSGLSVGTHSVVAKVAETDNYNAAESEALTITVAKADATIEVNIEDNELTFGESTTVSSIITPEGLTGDVTYYVDGTAITGNTVSDLSVGTHTVVAKLAETQNYTAAESAAKTITVSKATPEITITSEPVTYPNDAVVNIVLTGANSAALPGATIRVTINGTTYAVTTDNDGKASLTVKGLNVGEYAIAAVSVADNSYNSATYSGTTKVVVNKADATITVSADKESIKYGETATLSSVVTPGDDDGAVTYYLGETALDSNVLSGLAPGTYTVVAKVAATANYNEATSEDLTITVAKADATITVSADKDSIKYGESITLTSDVTPGDDGAVTYYVDGTAITGTTVSGLSVGTHTVVAKVAATDNYNAAESEALTITVAKADATIELTIDDNELTFGESTTVSSVVSPSDDDGAVTYYVDGTAITGTTVSGLSVGTHTVVAKVAETANYNAAESEAKTITVSKATPEITITSEPVTYPSDAIVNIVLTGANNAALPGATIRVTINGTTYAVTTDNEGKASLTVKGLNVGQYAIAAVSVADNSYNSATYDGSAKVVVNKADATITVSADKTSIKYGESTTVSSVVTPGDDDGAVTYYVDGTAITGTTVSGLSVGEHTVVAKVAATANYNEATSEALTITVAKADATITVSADKDSIKYGESITLTSDVTPGDDDGVVTYYVDGTAITGTTVSGLSVGTHTVVAKVAATDNYNAASSEALTITVERADASIEVVITDNQLTFGESTTVSSIITPEGLTGDVTYYVDGTAITGNTVSDLSVGTHTVVAKLAETQNYTAAESAAKTITVSKATPEITITSDSVAYPNDAIVNIVLTGANSAALPGATIRVTINGTTYAVTTDDQGKATLNVKGLNAGEYGITAVSVADDSYESATYTGTTKVVVEKSANAKVDVALVGDNIVVTLTGDNNVPLDGTVNVAIDDGQAVAVTITNGQGTLDASALTAGDHLVVATSVADDNYASVSKEKVITKSSAPKEAVITVTVDDIVYGKDAVVQVTFKDKEGNPLQDTLTVTIGDITKTVTIGEDGTGSVNVAGLNVGHYSAVVSFAGNDTYQATSKDDGFDVSKAATVIESEDIVVTANATETMVFTLKDSNGNLLAGKSITVSFNGQIYDLTTDSNGQIEMQIKMVNQGTYSITASYDGEANYEATTASFNVVVKPIAVKLTVTDVTYALSDTKYLTATLTAGDQPLANRIVTFSLNGKTYTGRTNAQGVVKIAVSLTAKKTYSVVASYGGDTTYGSAMAIYKLKVTK